MTHKEQHANVKAPYKKPPLIAIRPINKQRALFLFIYVSLPPQANLGGPPSETPLSVPSRCKLQTHLCLHDATLLPPKC